MPVEGIFRETLPAIVLTKLIILHIKLAPRSGDHVVQASSCAHFYAHNTRWAEVDEKKKELYTIHYLTKMVGKNKKKMVMLRSLAHLERKGSNWTSNFCYIHFVHHAYTCSAYINITYAKIVTDLDKMYNL